MTEPWEAEGPDGDPLDAHPDLAQPEISALLSTEGIAFVGLSQRQLAWRKFKRHRLALIGAAVLIVLGTACLLAPWIAPKGLNQTDTAHPFAGVGQDGFLLGSDNLGRDHLSRLLYGGRISMAIGLGVALIAGAFGTLVGSVAGYYGRWVDNALMRFTDGFLALPGLIVLIVASAAVGGSTVLQITLIISLVSWMPIARITRGVFLSLREKEFVESALAVGARGPRIIFRHLLPNAMGPVIVNVSLTVAYAILIESALSFLGYGVDPPTPTWGNMLDDSKGFSVTAPHLIWFPGLLILVTVLSVNLLGDGLRDALDPTQRKVGD